MTPHDFAIELRKWWSFDDSQQHTHSWHSREDFIKDKLPTLLAKAIAEGRRQMREEAAEVALLNAALKLSAEEIAAAIRAIPDKVEKK